MRNEDLGQLGETEFKRICLLSGLHWSKPEPDRTGKDCIIEWPFEPGISFDSRSPPRKCNIQVKSTRTGTARIKVKLSALEWLAKDLLPAFIVVPVFSFNGILDCFVAFHIDDDVGSRILRRLRETTRDAKNPVNQEFSFALKTGVPLKTHSEVRFFLQSTIGECIFEYARLKETWLKSTGYEPDSGPEYEMEIHASVSELADHILNEGTFRATFSAPKRERFGIKLPERDELGIAGSCLVSLHPKTEQCWTIRVRGSDQQNLSSLTMPFRSFAFPGMPIDLMQSRGSNGIIECHLRAQGSTFKFDFEKIYSQKILLDSLLESVRFWKHLSSEGSVVSVERDGSSPIFASLNAVEPERRKAHTAWAHEAELLLESALALYLTCKNEAPLIEYARIESQKRSILAAASKLDGSSKHEKYLRIRCEAGQAREVAKSMKEETRLLLTLPVLLGHDIMAIAILYLVSPEVLEDSVHLNILSKITLKTEMLTRSNAVSEYMDFYTSLREKLRPDSHAIHELIDEGSDS